jgi:hypothetical protein
MPRHNLAHASVHHHSLCASTDCHMAARRAQQHLVCPNLAGTPADKLLAMMTELLDGSLPSLQDILLIQSTILESRNIYQPFRLGKQLLEAKELEVSRGRRGAQGGGSRARERGTGGGHEEGNRRGQKGGRRGPGRGAQEGLRRGTGPRAGGGLSSHTQPITSQPCLLHCYCLPAAGTHPQPCLHLLLGQL